MLSHHHYHHGWEEEKREEGEGILGPIDRTEKKGWKKKSIGRQTAGILCEIKKNPLKKLMGDLLFPKFLLVMNVGLSVCNASVLHRIPAPPPLPPPPPVPWRGKPANSSSSFSSSQGSKQRGSDSIFSLLFVVSLSSTASRPDQAIPAGSPHGLVWGASGWWLEGERL